MEIVRPEERQKLSLLIINTKYGFPHVFNLKMTQRSLTYCTICWHIYYFQYYSIYIRTSYYFRTDISFLPEFDLSSFPQVKHSLCQASFLFLMEVWITRSLLQYRLSTAWKVSVFGVILVRMRGMRTRITPDTDTFRAVMIMLQFIRKNPKKNPYSGVIYAVWTSFYTKLFGFFLSTSLMFYFL